nr:reverse transcriptase domain-containing protein [Tanacetum cinerariifolium]
MEELCQPSLNGQGGPIALIAIQATNFRLKNDMIQQVQNSCQFRGLPGDNANKYLDKFRHVTQSIKVNGVTDDALRLYLFPRSLTHHATAWFDRLLRNSINTFEQMAKMFLGKYFLPSMAKLRNEITNFCQRPDESLFKAWEHYKLSIDRCPNHNMLPVTQIDTFFNGLTLRHRDTINAAAGRTFMKRPLKAEMAEINKNLMRVLQGTSHGQNPPPAYQAPAYQAPVYQAPVHQPQIPQQKVVTTNEFTNFMKANDAILKNIFQDQKFRDKANDQREKNFQIFKDLNFNISFANAFILMPKFGPSIKSLLTNKDKPYELARTPLNEHCSAVLLKKLLEKLGDPGKVLIPCDFPGMAECLALADLDASINLMPLSVWKKVSLPNLSPTSFLKTGRALIDVFEGELTLRVGKEAITFNLDQTSRYSANYNEMTANRIDVIDMACEEYSQEVLGFSDVIASGNPTPYYDLIVSTTSLTLTPFGDSDFLLKEVYAFLALEDDATSPKVDQSYFESEGDILLLEAFLNDDPSLPPLNQGNY